MLELAAGVGLGVDIGDFLELQRGLERRGIVHVAADKVHILGVKVL